MSPYASDVVSENEFRELLVGPKSANLLDSVREWMKLKIAGDLSPL